MQEQKKKPWAFLKSEGNISADESEKNTRKKLIAELIKTSTLVLCAFFTIVFGTAAWFVSNTKVDSGGIAISHQYETIKLATKGVRQDPEKSFLRLEQGTELEYNGEKYYYTEDKTVALQLSEQVVVSPGASGEVTFYVIPNRSGAQTVTVYLGLTGYEKTQENQVQWVNDPILDSLLNGHILLFQSHGEGGYSDWMDSIRPTGISSHAVSTTLQDAQEGVPYPVTVYWVWPLRYENMKDDIDSVELARFIEKEAQIQNMKKIDQTGYYYSQIFLTKTPAALDSGAPGSGEARSEAYNRADEYIGTNANYLYLTVQTADVQMQ